MKPDFTKEQAKEMYRLLVQIHEALKDKSTATTKGMKLNVLERGWLLGIDKVFEKTEKHKIKPAET